MKVESSTRSYTRGIVHFAYAAKLSAIILINTILPDSAALPLYNFLLSWVIGLHFDFPVDTKFYWLCLSWETFIYINIQIVFLTEMTFLFYHLTVLDSIAEFYFSR